MNETIFFFFYNFAHQSAFFDQLVTFFAVHFPYIVVMLAGVFLLMHHEVLKAEEPLKVLIQNKKEILSVFFSGIMAWIGVYILKSVFHLPRPFEALDGVKSLFGETGYAFPSSHAAFFSALSMAIFFTHKKAGYIFMFFALLIGLSRIIVGVHFPLDILGGFVFGFVVSYIIDRIFKNYNRTS